MNEPDSFALEEALRLKEKHGGEVVAISMGPERVKQTIKEALAKGAERGIHISDPEFFKLDPLGSACSIAAAIQKENFDLVLTGLQSDDQGFGQTGVLLAELLGRPHATIIMAIEVTDGRMKLKRELEAGWFQWVELPLPAVITIQSGINKVRYATLKGIMAAKKKEIATMDALLSALPDRERSRSSEFTCRRRRRRRSSSPVHRKRRPRSCWKSFDTKRASFSYSELTHENSSDHRTARRENGITSALKRWRPRNRSHSRRKGRFPEW